MLSRCHGKPQARQRPDCSSSSDACLLSKSGPAVEEYADPATSTLSFDLEITNNLLTMKGRKDDLVK